MSNNKFFWNKKNSIFPNRVLPSNFEELQKVIKNSKYNQQKILINCCDGYKSLAKDYIHLRTNRLNSILVINKALLTVKVEVGIKVMDLLKMLAKENLTLPNYGLCQEQTIGGAIATADHGSSLYTGTMCSFVLEMEILDGQGYLRVLNPEKDKHLFSAAVTGLGLMGIMYSLTLKCIPLIKLKLHKIRNKLEITSLFLIDSLKTNDFFQFLIDPYHGESVNWHYKITTEKSRGRCLKAFKHYSMVAMTQVGIKFLQSPSWIMPKILKFYLFTSNVGEIVDYSYLMLSSQRSFSYVEEEIAVPFEHLETALSITRLIIKRFCEQKKVPVAVILVRFSKADEYGYMSPAIERQTAFVSLITTPFHGYKGLLEEFEVALFALQGRPNWQKIHFLTKSKLVDLYKNNYSNFLKAKLEIDPEGLFFNELVQNLFG